MGQRRAATKTARPQASQGESTPVVQAGARKRPTRVPAQHQPEPGHEAALQPHRGSAKLHGKTALITGNDSGIGLRSVTGLEGSAHLLDYSTTKGAIHAFTKAPARNVLERGIRVNAIALGPVWTPSVRSERST